MGHAGCVVLLLWAATFAVLEKAQAADSTFQFEAAGLHPYAPAYLGNGLIGLETTALGTAPSHCFLAGVYDHTAGDVPRIASAPEWNEIDVYNGSHWLNSSASGATIKDYRQTLDMYDGVLRTSYLWVEDSRRIRVEAEEFVSRDLAGAAAVRLVLTPEFAGLMNVRMPLRNWTPPRRYPLERLQKLDSEAAKNPWLIWYPGHLDVSGANTEASPAGVLMSLGARAPGNGSEVGEAVTAEWTGGANVQRRKEPEGTGAFLTLNVKPGVTYTFTKFVAFATAPGSVPSVDAARLAALTLRQRGWQALYVANESAWHKLWESDIVVEGNQALQRTIHSMLFYLLGSVREGLSMSTPPMGLSSAGYYGHIFWDADTFLFPALLILHPELARPMVAFRSRTREAARKNARQNGYQGAMYPWEADPSGVEATPRFAGQNAKYENHVNGDIALAAWQYWLATGDRQWLEQDCWPILRDTADFWVSRVDYNPKLKRYEIGKVVGVNESLIGISNDAYTNSVAKKNLELAIAAAAEVHRQPSPKWGVVAENMYLPEGDSALFWSPLDVTFSAEKTRIALGKELKEIERGETGAMMGGQFYPILAAQLNDRVLIGKLLEPLWKPYLRPPFQVIAETPDNQNTSFITGAGAFLQQFVFGYSGLRFGDAGLNKMFRPVLPPGIHRLILQNITVRGRRETLAFVSPPAGPM